MRASGDREHTEGAGRGKSNFSGPKSSKSGVGVSPKASGSHWKNSRQDQAEKSYAADYTRKGSDFGSNATGPKKPSATRAVPLYAGNKDRRGD